MLSVVKGAAEAYEVECDVVLIGKSSSGASDDKAIEIVMRCARTIPWFTEFHDVGSVGGSDDASEMLRRVQKTAASAATSASARTLRQASTIRPSILTKACSPPQSSSS